MSSELVTFACTVCFGAADGPLLTAARLGVLVMVGITCGVLSAFAAFFLRLRNGDSHLFTQDVNREQSTLSKAAQVLRRAKKGDSHRFLRKKGTAT